MIKVAHFGYGYWGPNLVRNFRENPNCELAYVVDGDEEAKTAISKRYPSIATTSDGEMVLADPTIDAVSIATPACTHYELVKQSLNAGKHVLVEKPLCMDSREASELADLAVSKSLKLFVGHVFIYNKAVQELKRLIQSGELGEIYCIHSDRLSLGRVRSDVDVLWNLAPHDISILLYLLDEKPERIMGYGHSFLQKNIWDVGFIDLTFPSGIAANIHCSWLHPRKTREMTVVGSKKMVVYDDVSSDAKLSIFDHGIDKARIPHGLKPIESFAEFQLIKRTGDLTVPNIQFTEPLKEQIQTFINAIETGAATPTDGEMGCEVVRILEEAHQS